MRVTVTGATGLIGTRPGGRAARARRRGDRALAPPRARAGRARRAGRRAGIRSREPAPGRGAVGPRRGRASRRRARRAALDRRAQAGDPRQPRARHAPPDRGAARRRAARRRRSSVGSAIGYYGPHGEEPIDEEAPPGHDFLAQVCVEWEREAQAADGARACAWRRCAPASCSTRTAARSRRCCRRSGSASAGPVAGGRQYMAWIHRDDVVGIVRRRARDERWSGPFNATAPEPVTNAEFSRALGRALHRPAFAPVPGVRDQAAVRRDVRDRHDRRARRARQAARARLRVPPPAARRGAAPPRSAELSDRPGRSGDRRHADLQVERRARRGRRGRRRSRRASCRRSGGSSSVPSTELRLRMPKNAETTAERTSPRSPARAIDSSAASIAS